MLPKLHKPANERFFVSGVYVTTSIAEQLIFRPASEKSTGEMEGRNVLLFYPCDGWHEASFRVYRD
jgi:hypothetical protein